eukprot:SAG11_NODE_3103_length_2688_cov_4.246813_1_plen_63_part_00
MTVPTTAVVGTAGRSIKKGFIDSKLLTQSRLLAIPPHLCQFYSSGYIIYYGDLRICLRPYLG